MATKTVAETIVDVDNHVTAIRKGVKRFAKRPDEKRAAALLETVKALYKELGFELYADKDKGEKELTNKKEQKRQEQDLEAKLKASVKDGAEKKAKKEKEEAKKPKVTKVDKKTAKKLEAKIEKVAKKEEGTKKIKVPTMKGASK